MRPGAVPRRWGMKAAPSGMSAWRALLSAISRPRAPKKARMFSTMASSRRRGTFMTSATASRVMSSWVGPTPPHTMTASLRARAERSASTMRPRLSPTLVWKCESIPARARRSPIQAELVSTTWPSRSSVPTATTSHRTCRLPPVEQVLGARHEREDHRDPEERVGDRTVMRRRRQHGEAHRHVLYDGLDLGPPAGRHRDPPPAHVAPVAADDELTRGDQGHRQPPEAVLHHQRDKGAEHEELVGQRIEE